MSYGTTNYLPASTPFGRVLTVVELLGYSKVSRSRTSAEYFWYDDKDYHSYTGVPLSVRTARSYVIVETTTPVARSYFDLAHQNRTVRELKRLFGGSFSTDEGRGRYGHPSEPPPIPSQAGCHLAFQRFGGNLIRADLYLMHRPKLEKPWSEVGVLPFLDEMNPRVVSNNLLLPYLVATLEDYFKSTFVALLKYSEKKSKFLRSSRINSDHLAAIASGVRTVEESIAEILPFQKLDAILEHFHNLDSKLDLSGELRRPVKGRKLTLLDSLEGLVFLRHRFIHQAQVAIGFTDKLLARSINDLDLAVVRCYKRITKHYGWSFEQGWGRTPTRL
jgi:hypothetical protein